MGIKNTPYDHGKIISLGKQGSNFTMAHFLSTPDETSHHGLPKSGIQWWFNGDSMGFNGI